MREVWRALGLHTLSSASGRQVGNMMFPNLRKISQEIRKQYYNSVKNKCSNQHSWFEGIHMEERDVGARRADTELEAKASISRNRDRSCRREVVTIPLVSLAFSAAALLLVCILALSAANNEPSCK